MKTLRDEIYKFQMTSMFAFGMSVKYYLNMPLKANGDEKRIIYRHDHNTLVIPVTRELMLKLEKF